MLKDIRLGTDVVNLTRLEGDFQRYGEKFFRRVLTESERQYCHGPNFVQRAGGRIAIKEALAKALGAGINGLGYQQGVRWLDVEVISKPQQAPNVRLYGRAKDIAKQQAIFDWRLSLSHDGDTALATVIGLVSDAT